MKKTKNKSGKKYPGYPQYGREQDIYDNAEEIHADPENLNRDVQSSLKNKKKNPETEDITEAPVPKDLQEDEEEKSRTGNEITSEDLMALGNKDSDNDDGEDELLEKDRVYPIDMAGDDLDIPGAEEDDDDEMNGAEDEENNLYSRPD